MNLKASLLLGMVLALFSANSFAAYIQGKVYCDAQQNGFIDSNDTPVEGATIGIEIAPGGVIFASDSTDANGYYFTSIPREPTDTIAILRQSSLPADATIILQPGGQQMFNSDDNGGQIEIDWLIDSETCQTPPPPEGVCWMTGGGIKFDNIIGEMTARLQPKHSIGGVVHPGCSPDASGGGQWNHVDRSLKEHYQIFDVQQVSCGNVDDHPPGSESPVTPFNYIEWVGTGRMKGIRGNKTNEESVFFFGRVEDRNEPGSEGPAMGTDIDRYFLRAWKIGEGGAETELLCVDEDGDCSSVDPLTITGGNLQLHITSCD